MGMMLFLGLLLLFAGIFGVPGAGVLIIPAVIFLGFGALSGIARVHLWLNGASPLKT